VVLESMIQTAQALAAPGKGILAADESTPTMAKRLASIGLESTEQRRRAYREILFTSAGIEEFISGVILFDETLRQQTDDGVPFAEVLHRQGILPGIKVDKGAKALAGHPGETVTEGLDGLRERLEEYRGLGARFAKWRAVIHIGDGIPTPFGTEANAHALARYAMLCQEADLVPIVEPEVLMDGDHTLARCEEVTSVVLASVFDQLTKHRLHLEGMVLKPNMVISGLACPQQASAEEIAEATVRCFRRHVPAAVPGIAFLSGGQSESQATANLSALNRIEGLPWQLSFSFGRALQQTALATWGGQPANAAKAQEALLHRAHLNGLARRGAYEAGLE
jgi:fructose-bisphosphate aldolase class I